MWAPTSLGTLGTGRDRGRAPIGFESGPEHYILQLSPSLYFGVAPQRHRLPIHKPEAVLRTINAPAPLAASNTSWLRRT
jgi:hypothetical protein